MNTRNTFWAVLLVLAASCGGGGGGDQLAIAATYTPPSEGLLSLTVDGTSAALSDGTVPIDHVVNGGAFSATWQVQSAAEAYRVRLYFSGDDILGDRIANTNSGDAMFYDSTCAASACTNPKVAQCTFTSASSDLLDCTGDSSGGSDPGRAGFSGSPSVYAAPLPWRGFIIARICRVDNPGACAVWPVPVELR